MEKFKETSNTILLYLRNKKDKKQIETEKITNENLELDELKKFSEQPEVKEHIKVNSMFKREVLKNRLRPKFKPTKKNIITRFFD